MYFSIPILVSMAFGPSDGIKDVPACPGDNVPFILNTSKALKYCQWGGTEGKGPDAIPLDKSVRNFNEVTNANTTLSQRGNFFGNLLDGICAFVLNNFQQDDRKDHRVSGLDVGNTYRIEEYKITLKGNCTNSTVTEPTTTKAPSTGPADTTKAEKNETEAEKGTSPPNTTSKPSNSTPGSTPDDGNLLKVLLPLVLVLLVVVGVVAAVFCYRNMKTTKSSRNQKALKDITNDESYCPLDSREDIIGNADIWTGHAQDLNNGNDDVEDHGTVSTRDFTDNHLNYESEINGDSPTGLGIGISNSTDSETDPLNESNEMNGDDDVVPKGPGIIREL